MSREQVITRHPRDYTVQIRHTTTNTLVGTGIVVSSEKIVTCAHVVVAAGVNPRLGRRIPGQWEMVLQSVFGRKAESLMEVRDAEVGVYFPEWHGRKSEERRARVVAWFSEYEDDIVVLQLIGGPAPVRPEQIARLGTAEPSIDNPFLSYGYSPTDVSPASSARGTIGSTVERGPDIQLKAELFELKSRDIDAGMSGAGVLDTTRNLVVGLIAQRYYPGKSVIKDELSYAVDSNVLTFDPFNLLVQSEGIPLEEVPPARTDIEAARAAVVAAPGNVLHGAPAPLKEWVGRQGLLQTLNTDWTDPACHVSELVGFGGEGKSSLARHWLDQLLRDPSLPQPDGVFWWSCYDNRSVDALFETALQYLSSGSVDPRAYPSTFARAHFIAGMLTKGRFLFILDGLEVLQYQEGDAYGLLVGADLRELLSCFAAPWHQSFCLLTSRAPVIDLLNYTTMHHHDVERLSPKDGLELLRKLGVTGPDVALDRLVADWDGHALTLSLLGSYLVERYGGDVAQIGNLPVPIANEPRYERVQRILRRYDTHLSKAERAFLLLFSAFRLPVPESAQTPVFRTKGEDAAHALTAPLAVLDDTTFDALLQRLRTYHLVTYDALLQRYTTHPLIRTYYAARFSESDRSQVQAVHTRIKDYYLASTKASIESSPTLNDMVPLIEAVYHTCRAGDYDEALVLYLQRIHRDGNVLLQQLGAYETGLALMLEFFPKGDTYQEPYVSSTESKTTILNIVGFCLLQLGRQREAAPFFERSIAMDLSMGDWSTACVNYLNIADLHADLGNLSASADASRQALDLARRARDQPAEVESLACQAWAAHLLGDLKTSSALFQQAEALLRGINPQRHYLYGIRGLQHADHLWRVGEANYARQIVEAHLALVPVYRWANDEVLCHRILGDLDADANEHQSAQHHYDEALKIARGSSRWALIEALLAQGRWATRRREVEAAYRYLDEALSYAVAGDYRIYEVDISIALAWAYFTAHDAASARAQVDHAQHHSAEMGYHWGKVDAVEVLAALDRGS